MTPHESRVRLIHPTAVARSYLMPPLFAVYASLTARSPLGEGETEGDAWVNALRKIDLDDRTPLPGQRDLPMEAQ